MTPGETYGLVFRVEDVGAATDNGAEPAFNAGILPAVPVRIDSETGSARITSEAEIQGNVFPNHLGVIWPNVWHNPRNIEGDTTVDLIDVDQFNDPDGNAMSGIAQWINDVVPNMSASDFDSSFASSVCGTSADDAWGFIDFTCIEPGYFHIDVAPPSSGVIPPNTDLNYTELGGISLKFYCTGQADTATIASQYSKVETSAQTGSSSTSIITVTVEDQFGDRMDGAEVTYSTNNCKFSSASDISPAGGGTTVTTWTDTDSSSDTNYLANNPLEHAAGTAEATLDCSKGTPGTATITAIVQRPGSDIVLSQDVTVVGPTALTGLTLTLNPSDLECGNTILAVANAVDSLGQPVSDNTLIYFTTDTSSGVVGGYEGAQGGIQTKAGEAQVLIATDPGNPGTHTVIAYALDASGNIVAQTSKTYTCDAAVAPAAPTVVPPATGTGTGSITPPNTGDAGLAAGSTSNASLFVIAGAVAMVLAGLASIKFARN